MWTREWKELKARVDKKNKNKKREKKKKWEGERSCKDWGVKMVQMFESLVHMLRHFETFPFLLYTHLKVFLKSPNDFE